MQNLLRNDSRFAGAGAGKDEREAAGFDCGFLGGVKGAWLSGRLVLVKDKGGGGSSGESEFMSR